MELEPLSPAAAGGEGAELRDMARRFWIAVLLSAPLVLWEMLGHLPGMSLHRFVAPSLATRLELLLATPVVFWAGGPFFLRAWASVRNRSLNMFSLIALGVGAAYVYSLVATFAPGLFPPSLQTAAGTVPVYYEAAAAITVLVLLGQVLELRAREKNRPRHPFAAESRSKDRLSDYGRWARRGNSH
jgi:P-type Cu+ transporter